MNKRDTKEKLSKPQFEPPDEDIITFESISSHDNVIPAPHSCNAKTLSILVQLVAGIFVLLLAKQQILTPGLTSGVQGFMIIFHVLTCSDNASCLSFFPFLFSDPLVLHKLDGLYTEKREHIY